MKWISTKEETPNNDSAVLFITEKGRVLPGHFHENEFSEWQELSNFFKLSEVTHWMPLPDPPKE